MLSFGCEDSTPWWGWPWCILLRRRSLEEQSTIACHHAMDQLKVSLPCWSALGEQEVTESNQSPLTIYNKQWSVHEGDGGPVLIIIPDHLPGILAHPSNADRPDSPDCSGDESVCSFPDPLCLPEPLIYLRKVGGFGVPWTEQKLTPQHTFKLH